MPGLYLLKLVLTMALLLPLSTYAHASAQHVGNELTMLSASNPSISLTQSLKLYKAPANIEAIENIDLSRVIKEATRRNNYNIEDPGTDYWFVGEFKTGQELTKKEAVIVLDHPYPLYDQVSLILNPQSANPQIFNNGNAYAIDNRPIKTRLMAFEIPIEPNQTYQFVLKVHSLAKQPFSLSVQTIQHFLAETSRVEFFWGIYFGMFFIAGIYNLLIFAATQQRVYLYYVFFIISTGLAQAGVTSHGITYIWPFASEWNNGTNIFFIGFAGVFGILFTQTFLKTRECAPKVHFLLNITHIPCVLLVAFSQLLRYDVATTFTDLTLTWLLCLMMSAGIISYKSGEKTARFFLLGWGALMVCIMVYILMMRGFITPNRFTLFAPQIGSILEISILTIAIGDRIRQDRRDKVDAIALQKATIGKLRQAEEALTQQALHDINTGLANQNMLAQAIDKALAHVNDSEMYLTLVKIKDLREINNTLGRYVGDEMAKFIGLHLKENLKNIPQQFQYPLSENGDNLAVIQGVTFAFLIKAPNHDSAINLVTNTLGKLPKVFQMDSISLDIDTVSGICAASQANHHTEIWMRNAFVAIEQALQFSKSCQIYDEAFNPYSERRLSLINDLKKAVEQDELQVYFQPQLDAKTKTIVSAEALLRWNHSEHGFVPPDEFIQLAENSGVIKPLTRWVLKNAIKSLYELHQRGYMVSLSINISPQNLEEADLTNFIVDTLKEYNVKPQYLTFEITETAMLANPDLASNVLHQWNNMGLVTAIDDFGTGYSSLSHLKRLPMKELKIDRSFIKDMLHNEDDYHIVEATMAIGHSLGMRVVAEGVEDEPLLNELTKMNCDLIQGYFLTPPLGLHQFMTWLNECNYRIGHPKILPLGHRPKGSKIKGNR